MLKSFTFGCGQGATKAMIECIENGVLLKNRCIVVNSTIKDVPYAYRDNAIIISEDPNAGCGKVREAAKVLMMEFIKNNDGYIESVIDEDTDYINIMATSEGASGSGASVVLAQYIQHEVGIPVIITLISGFESDTRGLQNTINYFKDLAGGDFTINTISNKRFLKEANNNTFVAETLANKYISDNMRIISAKEIVDSDQNIDDTDHYKLITNPGIIFCGEVEFDERIKNKDQFNKIIGDMIDSAASLDFSSTATKIGVFMNIADDTLEFIDTGFESIKKKLCNNNIPELFIHRQNEKDSVEFVRVIASGICLPKHELSTMYNKFVKSTEQTNSNSDDFFDELSKMNTNLETEKKDNKKDNFFSTFENSIPSNSETSSVLGRNRRRKFTSNKPSEESDNTEVNKEKKKSKFSTSNKVEFVSEDSIVDKY